MFKYLPYLHILWPGRRGYTPPQHTLYSNLRFEDEKAFILYRQMPLFLEHKSNRHKKNLEDSIPDFETFRPHDESKPPKPQHT